jgi:autotransporter-associated beta strand protein
VCNQKDYCRKEKFAKLLSRRPLTSSSGNVDNFGAITFNANAGGGVIRNLGQGSTITFSNSASGGSASLSNSGKIFFQDSSNPTSAIINNAAANSIVDFSSTVQNRRISAAEISGAGTFFLGSSELTVGSSNRDRTVTGALSDGGQFGGTGGSIVKVGTGTLVLDGNNTFTGPTTVRQGELVVNGQLLSADTVVASAGELGGNATVNNLTVAGEVAPGASIGTINVLGKLTLGASATYLVDFARGSDRINVLGTATLGGTVVPDFLASSGAVARQYDILHADGGFGGTTFSNVSALANYLVGLTYGPTDVFLDVTPALGLGSALPGNASNVANAINGSFLNTGTLPPAFLGLYDLTGANLADALTQASGEAATQAQQVAFQLTNQFLNIMLDPFVDGRGNPIGGGAIGFAAEREELSDDVALAYAKILKAPPKQPSFEQRWSGWGAGYGGSNRTSGDPAVVGSHDLAASTAGGAAGLDYRLAPGTVVGFALAGGGTNWSLAQGLGGGKSDAFQAGIYGTARSGPAYLAAALAFTNHWMSTDRFAFAGDHLTASFNAQSYGGRVEGGYRFVTYYGGLTPYAAIQSQTFHAPGYTETDLNGGGFALGFNSRNATDTRSELGGRFDRLLLLNPGAALTMRARVAWAHDWISDPTLAAVFQTLPGASFIVNGATPAKNSVLVSEGAELRLANGVTLLAKFDGEFASHSSTYAGTGTVRYTW